jgi:hypothetical protein
MMTGAFTTLRDEVQGTQSVLGVTIQEAKVALNTMHDGFRQALATSAAEQRHAVEALITHARVKFVELEVKLDTLNASAAHVAVLTEQWALGESARTAQQTRLAAPLLGTPGSTPPPSPRTQPAADP